MAQEEVLISRAQAKQRKYYENTADTYNASHVVNGDEHCRALQYAAQLMKVVGARSLLDVGAGSGRGIRLVRTLHPQMQTVALEPVPALREQASRHKMHLVGGSGEKLPFATASVDVVIATGVMHHVPDPRPVVSEMLRVARLGVMISDSNRFGQGNLASSLMKSALHTARLWPIFTFVRTRGRGYMQSEGDGIFYSYSIYDSLPAVQSWADDSFIIPTRGAARGRSCGYRSASHGLLVGMRDLPVIELGE